MQMQQQIAATVLYTSHQVRQFADLCVQRAENPFLPSRNIHPTLHMDCNECHNPCYITYISLERDE
jgi:hypothetical protein